MRAISANLPCIFALFLRANRTDCIPEQMFLVTKPRTQDKSQVTFLQKYGVLAASIVLALIVGAAGVAKLMGVPMVHQSFGILGLPAWFGYFIGAAEVAGAIGLFIPSLSRLAAAGLAIIGVGAVYFHIMHTPLSQGVPAMVMLALALFVAVKRRAV